MRWSHILTPLIVLLLAAPEAGCMSMFPCGTPITFKDCRPFGALQGDEAEESPEPRKPLIICRDANRDYYGLYADACPKGDVRIG